MYLSEIPAMKIFGILFGVLIAFVFIRLFFCFTRKHSNEYVPEGDLRKHLFSSIFLKSERANPMQ